MTDELREAMKKSRKESEMSTVDSQIRGLETRLRYAKGDMDNTVWFSFFINTKLELKVPTLQQKQIKTVERDIANVEEEMKRYGPEIEAIERSMLEREQRIEEIKLKMNTVEDDVFSDFCNEIGETIFKNHIGSFKST